MIMTREEIIESRVSAAYTKGLIDKKEKTNKLYWGYVKATYEFGFDLWFRPFNNGAGISKKKNG